MLGLYSLMIKFRGGEGTFWLFKIKVTVVNHKGSILFSMTNEFHNPNICWPLLNTYFELGAIINHERGSRTSITSGKGWLWIINNSHFYNKFDQSDNIFYNFLRTQSHSANVWQQLQTLILNVKQSAMRGGRSMSEMRFILPPLSII
jgi:hypothetical protein